MKRPASQYYWGDWRRDTALQGCSLTARGLWHEMNCLMHDCEPYGHLSFNGKPMPVAKLARLVGATPKECQELLDELEEAGIFSKGDDGMIFSRRMVRDEAVREARAEGGKLGAEHGIKGKKFGSLGGRPRGEKTPPSPDDDGGGGGGIKQPPSDPPPASASASAKKEPSGITPPLEGGATPLALDLVDDPLTAGFTPTPGGAICQALKAAGMFPVNPTHPTLLALVDAGATAEELVAIVPECRGKGDAFTYLLAVATNRRQRAAELAPTLHRGPLPRTETDWQRSQRERVAEMTGGIAAARAPWEDAASPKETADVVDITARRLG